MKRCTKCGVEKPFSAFTKHKLGRDGLRPRCRECTAAENAVYRAENGDKIKAYNETYRAEHAAERAAYSRRWNQENRQRANENGYRWKRLNPDKVRAAKRAWRLANPEKVRATKRASHERNREAVIARVQAWREANPMKHRAQNHKRRVLEFNAPGAHYTTAEHIAARIAYYGEKCVYCSKPWEAIDHRVPLARGGTHWPSNLVPACRSCNSRKHAKTELEFRAA